MKVSKWVNVQTDVNVDVEVDLDAVLAEFVDRVAAIAEAPKRWRLVGPVLDRLTKIMAAVPAQTIAEMPDAARLEMAKRLAAELARFTSARTARELRLQDRLDRITNAVAKIVCTEGNDAGVVLLSHDSPTTYDESVNAHVFDHAYFSPLGDALMALWEITQEVSEPRA